MKVASIIHQLRRYSGIGANHGMQLEYRLIHTDQHYDEKMSDNFFDDLGIPVPDINLTVDSGSHEVQTANVKTKFGSMWNTVDNKIVIVIHKVR
jgi:UDP-N-acetylglucosamine 2-epimerase (non-hydrolysing)